MATRLQTKLQAASDATVLALCQTPDATTSTVLQTQALTTMLGYMPDPSLTVDTLSITPSTSTTPRTISLAAHVNSGTYFGAFTGKVSPKVTGTSQCSTPVPRTFEIALVLDNTGSMAESSNGQTKMAALKTAANNFIEYVYNKSAFSSSTKISIVPFAGAVTVKDPTVTGDYTSSNANWIDWTAQSTNYHWKNINKDQAASAGFKSRNDIFKALASLGPTSTSYPYYGWNWGGCIETPPYPENVQDGAPSTSNPDSLYQMYFAPDEPGGGTTSASEYQNNSSYYVWNSYIDDGTAAQNCTASTSMAYLTAESRGCKYLSAQHSSPRNSTAISLPTGEGGDLGQNGPNWGCSSAPLQRLLNAKTAANKTTLESLINKMSARGSTNIHEGFMWGWRTLSPLSVFADGAAYNTASTPPTNAVNKVVILMTDGMDDWLNLLSNTANGAIYNALGYPTNSATGDAAGSSPNGRLQSTHQNPVISSGTTNIWNPASNSGRSAIDGLFAEACTNAKASPANISIWTIAFSISGDPIDTTGINLLKNCASSGQYILANNSDDLIAGFNKIANSIGALRISQ